MYKEEDDENVGYLPLIKFKEELKNNNSIKDSIYSFFRTQNCLIQGKENLLKLKSFFKNSVLLDSKYNHIFVLDTNVYIIFVNRKDSKLLYVYNEFSFEITNDVFQHQELNKNHHYYAFNFLNQKIEIIKDYFDNIFTYNLNDELNTKLFSNNNIVYIEPKTYISSHDFKHTITHPHFKIMSDMFKYVNEYALENYKESSSHNMLLYKTDIYSYSLLIRINNGVFFVKSRCSPIGEDEDVCYENSTLAMWSSTRTTTIYPPCEDYIYRVLPFHEELTLLQKLNIKNKLQDYFGNLNKTPKNKK